MARRFYEDTSLRALCAALDGNVRYVGGAVRDYLLGREAKDVDCASPLLPEEIAARLEGAGMRAVHTGAGHGGVTAYPDGVPVQITTLREDVACDGRRATVAYTTDWSADARRRDFTVNALYMDPDGCVYDYVGSYADIAAGRLAFIGEPMRRCEEDYLRILRFFRFYAQLPLARYDEASYAACVSRAEGLARLSRERIGAETAKLLAAPHYLRALLLMLPCPPLLIGTGLDALLPPEADAAALTERMRRFEASCAAFKVAPSARLRTAALLLSAPRSGDRPDAAENAVSRYAAGKREAAALALLVREARSEDMRLSPRTAAARLYDTYGTPLHREIAVLSLRRRDAETEDGSRLLGACREAEEARREFPLSAADLSAAGVPRRRLSAALGRLRARWRESMFSMDREELLREAAAQTEEDGK
jgi:poly(A) polymerase